MLLGRQPVQLWHKDRLKRQTITKRTPLRKGFTGSVLSSSSCLSLGKLCAFLEASPHCHGRARRFVVSPSGVSKELRSYQKTGHYTKRRRGGSIGATAQQWLPEPWRFPPADSSWACFCSETGRGVGLASLGETSMQSPALSSLVSTSQGTSALVDSTVISSAATSHQEPTDRGLRRAQLALDLLLLYYWVSNDHFT